MRYEFDDGDPCQEPDWKEAENRLMDAVPAGMRPLVRSLLSNPRRGGRGLRSLLILLASQNRSLPCHLPGELVEIYLQDDAAEPIHDCEECGLPVPVRVARRCGHEPSTERVYYPACPHCGGRTGRYAYWSGGAVRNHRSSLPAGVN